MLKRIVFSNIIISTIILTGCSSKKFDAQEFSSKELRINSSQQFILSSCEKKSFPVLELKANLSKANLRNDVVVEQTIELCKINDKSIHFKHKEMIVYKGQDPYEGKEEKDIEIKKCGEHESFYSLNREIDICELDFNIVSLKIIQ